jgi:hypothetical protein
MLMGQYERTGSIRPAGVMATACRHKGIRRNTGSPGGDRCADQLATRERQARPYGVTERLVVPTKPGNAGVHSGGSGISGVSMAGDAPEEGVYQRM